MMSKRFLSLACAFALAACAGPETADTDGGAGMGGEGGGAGGVGGGAGGVGGGAGGMGGNDMRNQRPELARIGDREAPAEEQLSIQLMATDPEGAALTFNVRSSLPDGAKFEKATGLFTWTPRADQEGLIALITFEVSDGELKDQETIQITVVAPGAAVNRPPEVDEIGDQVVTAGQPFDLQIEASDPNGDPLSYALRGDAIEGASLGADTGLFTWTPAADLVGMSFNVEFVVSDGVNETVVPVKFVVREPGNVNPGNLPPVIMEIPDAELRVGERFELQIQVEDEMPDSLTYLIAGAAPAGAALDPSTGLFTWTPVAEQADQAIRVIFRVSDGEFTAAERATFQVRPAEDPMMGMCDPDPEGDDPLAIMDGADLQRTICPGGNRDTYTIAAQANDRIQADVTFTHADGDIDAVLYGPAGGEPLVISEGVVDNEQVVHVAAEAGDYRLVVYAVGRAETEYGLTLSVEGGGEQCANDAFEAGAGNNVRENATAFADAQGQQLAICGDDSDWFAVDLQAGVEATITLRFSHADGDIDATLYTPDNAFATSGTSSNDDEVIRYTPMANGVHTLRVYGFRVERNTYTVDLEVGEPVDCDDDRVEPNDSHDNAEPFPDELYRNLTFCGDPDWYKTNIPDGNQLQVYISYTGARAPTIEAFTPGMVAVPGTTFEVAEGDGCQAGRAGCRVLTVPGPVGGGFIHYEVRNLEIAADYDLNVRVNQAAGCAMSCDELEVCDDGTGMCVDAFCNPDGTGCPDSHRCYDEWCIQGCQLGDCPHPDHVCKKLDGAFWCGLSGPDALGDACIDFTDCQGSFDCLNDDDIPDGYCSQVCNTDAECGAGGHCIDFGDGQFCAKACNNIADCREGYGCNIKARVEGGNRDVCTPGIEI